MFLDLRKGDKMIGIKKIIFCNTWIVFIISNYF